MLQATKFLNQITKNFFRQILLSQGYREGDFYLKGEVYNNEDLYFCFKDDLETGTTICFLNLYLDPDSGFEWYVEKFCLSDEYILSIREERMRNTVQWEFGILESYAIKIPLSYVIKNSSRDFKILYKEIYELSSTINYHNESDLEIMLHIPWLKEIQSAISYAFTYFNIQEFFYIAPYYNIYQIIKSGFIKSRNEIEEWGNLNTDIEDFSNSNVQQLRSNKTVDKIKLHDFVNLYLNPLNPMIYSKKQEEKIAILGISTLVSFCKNSYITDGNAASKRTLFSQMFNELDRLNWSTIFSNSWHDKPDGKRIRCAEVLVPCRIPVEYIDHIYFKSSANKNIFLDSFKEILLKEIDSLDKTNWIFLPKFSSQDMKTLEYIYECTEQNINEFLEAVNSISKVQPNLFS